MPNNPFWLRVGLFSYKKWVIALALLVLYCWPHNNQLQERLYIMSFMVGHKFPDVKLKAVMGNGEMKDVSVVEHAKGKMAVVFFYPLDFTFVCPTEIVAFDKAYTEFKKRGVELFGASVDSQFAHHAWRETPLDKGGIGPVQFPLLADLERKLSTELGILTGGVTFRASYLIDKTGTVRHMVVNDLPLGRSVEEMLRMVDALQFHEEHGEVCPANWRKGEDAIKPTAASTGAYLAKKHSGKGAAA
jgi:peroxiredoxin (alkyl hydroperoxide reductase subunit C)